MESNWRYNVYYCGLVGTPISLFARDLSNPFVYWGKYELGDGQWLMQSYAFVFPQLPLNLTSSGPFSRHQHFPLGQPVEPD